MKCVNVFLSLVIFFGAVLSSYGVPHSGEQFRLKQPDGSSVQVKVFGDDYYQRVESLEGYTLIRNDNGWICYAILSHDEMEFLPTAVIYTGLDEYERISGLRLTKSMRLRAVSVQKKVAGRMDELGITDEGKKFLRYGRPLSEREGLRSVSGDMKGITILIDFSDQTGKVSKQMLDDYCNKKGFTLFGNNGSIHDYFFDVSGGKLNYTNHVTEYYRAKQPKSYYDHPTNPKASELVLEALKAIDQKGFDYSTLTTDNKKILAVNILYAGFPSHGWAKGLWPHMHPSFSSFSADGVRTMRYQMTNIGDTLKIGTFCHENGHMVGEYPDLYDYGGESRGVGTFCVMCRGALTNEKINFAFNPVPPCAPLRDIYTGWDKITPLNNLSQGTVLLHAAGTNRSFQYKNTSNSNESFYIEAMIKKGRYSQLLDQGLAIWHVDKKGSNDNEQMTASKHYLVSLEQADGRFDMEKTKTNDGDSTDLFHKGFKNNFDDNTNPGAKWWNNSTSKLSIGNISEPKDSMSFTIGNDPTALDDQLPGIVDPVLTILPTSVNAHSTMHFVFSTRNCHAVELSVFSIHGKRLFSKKLNELSDANTQKQYSLTWDLTTSQNQRIGSGIYIAKTTFFTYYGDKQVITNKHFTVIK